MKNIDHWGIFIQGVSFNFLAFLLSFIFPDPVSAQNPLWENHLCTTEITGVREQKDYYWLTTNGGGLLKANHDYSVVEFFNKSNSGLPSVFLSCLAIDQAGNKWIGTSDGITGLIRVDTNNHFTSFNTSNSGIPANNILSIAEHNGTIWLGMDSALVKFDGVNWTVYSLVYYANHFYPVVNVTDIAFDTIGSVWISAHGQGVMAFDGINWKVITATNCHPITSVNTLTFDKSGNLWIGYYYTLAKLVDTVWTSYGSYPPCSSLGPMDKSLTIRCDTNGSLWSEGMHWLEIPSGWYAGGFNIVPAFFAIPQVPPYYTIHHFSNLFIDKSCNKWMGSGWGLMRYDYSWMNFTPNIKSDLTSPGIVCLDKESFPQSLLIAGFYPLNYTFFVDMPPNVGSGLTSFSGNSWSQHDTKDSCIHRSKIFSMLGKNDNLWMGVSNGVYHYDGSVYTLYQWNTVCMNNEFTTALGPFYQTPYAGTNTGKLMKFDGTNWIPVNTILATMGSYISCITGTSDTLLIGSHNGILKYDTSSTTIYSVATLGLPSDTINDILRDDFLHCYWVATDKGLAKTDFHTYITIYNTINSGLPENVITALALDDLHHVWIGTKSKGVVVFNGVTFKVFNTLNSGLTDNRITDIITYQTDIWIGTVQGGLCTFHYGIWLSDNNMSNLLPVQSSLPDLQIYPNPVQDNVTLTISLSHAGKTTLIIYNSLGKNVKTLFDGNSATSQFTIHWNTSGNDGNMLNPGVYFCTLFNDDRKVTRRIVVLK